MYDLEWTYDKIAEAQVRAHALKLAIQGIVTAPEADANALETLVLDCVNSLDELVASATATVELTETGDKKIEVIKQVRALTGLGLMEAKDLVEGAPEILKLDVAISDAIKIKRALEGVGATVSLI
jgi:large subunit ribosomal protein L7/L12